jgi:hypothetical protein
MAAKWLWGRAHKLDCGGSRHALAERTGVNVIGALLAVGGVLLGAGWIFEALEAVVGNDSFAEPG